MVILISGVAMKEEDEFLKLAIEQSKIAFSLDEVPVGAVIVKDGVIIAKAHNLKESLKDVTAHAEILVIREAEKFLDNFRLSGCDLYVTLEPCSMCASAIAQARIRRVYIGTFDPNMGACGSVINIIQNQGLGHFVDIKWIYNEECSNILKKFFNNKRKEKGVKKYE